MKCRKILCACAVLLLCTGLLSACSDGAEQKSLSPANPADWKRIKQRTNAQSDGQASGTEQLESGEPVFQPDQSHQQMFYEQPISPWMADNLAAKGYELEISGTDWYWNNNQSHQIAAQFRARFDAVIRIGASKRRFDGLTVDFRRYNGENNFRAELQQLPLWVDEEVLLVSRDGQVEVYELAAEGLRQLAVLDYSAQMNGEMFAFPTYFQELPGGEKLLAVTLREEAYNHMTVLTLLDADYAPQGQNAVQHYFGLGRDHGNAERNSYELAPLSDGGGLYELRPAGEVTIRRDKYAGEAERTRFFLQIGQGAVWQQMDPIFNDGGFSSPEHNLRLYEKAEPPMYLPEPLLGERYAHLAVFERGDVRKGCFVREYDSTYELEALGTVLGGFQHDEMALYYEIPDEERYRPYTLSFDADGAALHYSDECVTLRVGLDGTLSLRTDYTPAFLQQEGSRMVDATADGRHQLWKVRVRRGHESETSAMVLYDSVTGAIEDFGNLGQDYCMLSLYDERHVAVVSMRERSGYPWGLSDERREAYGRVVEQSVRFWDLETGALSELPFVLGEIGQKTYLRAYAHDPETGRHALLASMFDELDGWEKVPYDNYALFVFDERGVLLSVEDTGVEIFHYAMYTYAPATLRFLEEGFWLYSCADYREEASWVFDPAAGEAAQALSGEFARKMETVGID